MRLEEWKLYYKFLKALADKIIREAKAHSLPRLNQVEVLSKIPSAFHTISQYKPTATVPEGKGPKRAWYVYVAGSEADYANIRQKRTCYGSDGADWVPYLPDDENIIGTIAATVATEKKLMPERLSIGNDFIKQLQDAEDNNTMVVIIVDPWSLMLPTLEQPMKAFDRERLTNCGVVVLWNRQDEETYAERHALQTLLLKTFSRNVVSKDITFQPFITNITELRDKLGAAIEEVKTKIYERGRVVRGEMELSFDPFPQLPTPATVNPATADAPAGAARQ
jgi:FxsC-like protein